MNRRNKAALVLGLTGLLAGMLGCNGGGPQNGSGTRPSAASAPRDPAIVEAQARRKVAVDRLLHNNTLYHIRDHEVLIKTKFFSLSLKEKQEAMAVVAAYCYELPEGGKLAPGQSLRIRDGRDGTDVGTFGPNGLELKDQGKDAKTP